MSANAEAVKNKQERFVYQDDSAIEKPFDWGVMSRLFVYMKPYKKQFLPVVLLMFIGAAIQLAVPFLIS